MIDGDQSPPHFTESVTEKTMTLTGQETYVKENYMSSLSPALNRCEQQDVNVGDGVQRERDSNPSESTRRDGGAMEPIRSGPIDWRPLAIALGFIEHSLNIQKINNFILLSCLPLYIINNT